MNVLSISGYRLPEAYIGECSSQRQPVEASGPDAT